MEELPIPHLPSLKLAPFANLETCKAAFGAMGGSLDESGGEQEFQTWNFFRTI